MLNSKQQTVKQEKEHKEKLDLLQQKANWIIQTEHPDWYDIFDISDSGNDTCMQKISRNVHSAGFLGIIEISELKQQITWGPELKKALGIMEKVTVKTFNDTRLKELMAQLQGLLDMVQEYPTFAGYDALQKEISSSCPELYGLLYTQEHFNSLALTK